MPKYFKRALLLLTVIALLLTSLCACTGDTEPGGSDPVTAQSGELPPSEEPGRNSVTVGIATDVASLDPHYATTGDTRAVMFNMFEGLVKASPEGGVTYAVASDYTVSDDGLTYTFTLREGVTFHNGEPVTAEDVVYSLKRVAGENDDGVPLVSAFSNVKTVETDEAGHVVLTLNTAGLEFINSLTSAPIIPAGSASDIDAAAKSYPIGTGPFQLTDYEPGDYLTMKKYDGYWGKKAHLDQVTFRFMDVDAMMVGLQGGTLDLVTKLPSSYLATVENSFTVLNDTMKLVVALYLNNDVEPLNDPLVRQAMYYAIDADELNTFMCDGGGVLTGTSMYPAQKTYFIPELTETYPHNVEKAKELLAQAGYPDGFALTVIAPSDYDQYVQGAEVVAEQLKQVGITVKVELTPFSNWTTEVYRGREFEATICAIASNDMSAREMLERYTTDATKNFINFSNEEFDRVVAAAKATLDQEEQIALYKRAEKILNEEAASLWLMDMNELVVMNPALDGYTFYCTYVLDLSTVYYK